MATKSGSSLSSKNASPGIIAAAVVVVLALVFWLAYANLFAPPKAPPMSPQAQQKNEEFKVLARKTHGDVSKLSPEEYQKFMQETGGYGAGILKKIAQDNGY